MAKGHLLLGISLRTYVAICKLLSCKIIVGRKALISTKLLLEEKRVAEYSISNMLDQYLCARIG